MSTNTFTPTLFNSKHICRLSLLSIIFLLSGVSNLLFGAQVSDSIRFEVLQKASSDFVNMDYPKALEKGQEALILAQKMGEKYCLARAHKQLGYLYWIDGYYNNSIENLDKAKQYYFDLDDKKSMAWTLHTKALNYYYMALYDSAINYHQQALALYRGLNEEISAGKVLSHLSLVYHKMGKYDLAIENMLQANRLRLLNSSQGSALDLRNSNPAFLNQEYYEAELEFHQNSLTSVLMGEDKLKIADAKLNVGLTYYLLEEYEFALRMINEANLLFEDIGYLAYWNESAKALRELNQFEKANQLLESYAKVIEKRGTRITYSEIKSLQGDIYFNHGEYKNAVVYYQVNLELAREMNNQLSIARHLRKLADAYEKLGETILTRHNLKESLALAKIIGAVEEETVALGRLANIESKLGNYQVAYNYQVEHDRLMSKIVEGEASLNMVRAQAEYEAFQKAEEINNLKVTSILQATKVNNLRIIAISGSIVLLLIILLTITIYWRSKLKDKTALLLEKKNEKILAQKLLLEDKNRENELLLGEIHHRVKNNLQVVNSLLSIQSLELKDKNAKKAVIESKNRVQAMGLIHENLYQSNNFGTIKMTDYLQNLSQNLTASFGVTAKVRVDINCNNINLDVDTAVPLGLIANELVTNSLKYAFDKVDLPVIRITLYQENNKLYLEVADNGCGMGNLDVKESFGLLLVKEMAKRMEGKIVTNCDSGTTTCLEIKKFKVAA